MSASGHLSELISQFSIYYYSSRISVFYYNSSNHFCFQVSIRKIHANAIILYVLNEATWGYLLIDFFFPYILNSSCTWLYFLSYSLSIVIWILWGSSAQNLISFLNILWVYLELQNQMCYSFILLLSFFQGVKCWSFVTKIFHDHSCHK